MIEYMGVYIEEAREHLEALNESLLQMEEDPGNKDVLNRIFRAAHTIKGSSSAMGFINMENLTHGMEDVLHELREGNIGADKKIIELLFVCHDFLENCLDYIIKTGCEEEVKIDDLLYKLHSIIEEKHNIAEAEKVNLSGSKELKYHFILDMNDKRIIKEYLDSGYNAYIINITFCNDCVLLAVRAWMVFNALEDHVKLIKSEPVKPSAEEVESGKFELNGTGIWLVVASEEDKNQLLAELDRISEIENIHIDSINNYQAEFSAEHFKPVSSKERSYIEDLQQDNVSKVIDGIIGGEQETIMDIDTTLLNNSTCSIQEHIEKIEVNLLSFQTEPDKGGISKKKTGEILVEHGIIGKEEEHNVQKNAPEPEGGYMRISTQKVDSLVDMLGELMIFHSLLVQESEEHFNANDKYVSNLMRMSKIIKDVQNLSMSLRMVSLKSTFQKLKRIGRDTAVELGKDVIISVSGEDTDIDRSVTDKILDPLMHMVRNAIAHGIEGSETRVKKGKAAQGHVSIKAYSKRGSVYIEVGDDGNGLSIDRIYSKAIEKNLIKEDTKYSDDEIIKFIFLPGFSTQETINNISGRGVGMNVVETEISKIGGKIEIVNKPGEGSVFTVKIPLNLAVMNGTVIDIFGRKYIIPTVYIKQFIKPEDNQWISVKGKRKMLRLRDRIIQVIPIREIFGDENDYNKNEESMIIVIELEQKLKALPVRAVVSRQEIVAKPLGQEFRGLHFVSGASIMGDGKVSLILDVEALFKIE